MLGIESEHKPVTGEYTRKLDAIIEKSSGAQSRTRPMHIDEYIAQHPEKLPEGRELKEFSAECESYLGHASDLVPYDDEHYEEKVFDICISMCSPMDGELEALCEYHDMLLTEPASLADSEPKNINNQRYSRCSTAHHSTSNQETT